MTEALRQMAMAVERDPDDRLRTNGSHGGEDIRLTVVTALRDHRAMQLKQDDVDRTSGLQVTNDLLLQRRCMRRPRCKACRLGNCGEALGIVQFSACPLARQTGAPLSSGLAGPPWLCRAEGNVVIVAQACRNWREGVGLRGQRRHE